MSLSKGGTSSTPAKTQSEATTGSPQTRASFTEMTHGSSWRDVRTHPRRRARRAANCRRRCRYRILDHPGDRGAAPPQLAGADAHQQHPDETEAGCQEPESFDERDGILTVGPIEDAENNKGVGRSAAVRLEGVSLWPTPRTRPDPQGRRSETILSSSSESNLKSRLAHHWACLAEREIRKV